MLDVQGAQDHAALDPGAEREVLLPGAGAPAEREGASPPAEAGGWPDGALRCASLVALCLCVDFLLMTIVVAVIPAALPSATDLEVSAVFAAKPAVQVLCNPVAARVGRGRPQLLLRVGLLVEAGATAGMIAHASLGAWVAARAVQGAASAGIMTGGLTLIAHAVPDAWRGRAMGVAMQGLTLGVLTGPLLGGALYHAGENLGAQWGQRLPFLLIAGMLVLLAAYQLFLGAFRPLPARCSGGGGGGAGEEEPAEPAPGRGGGVWAYATDPYVAAASGCMFVQHAAVGAAEATVPLFLARKWGLSALYQGLLFTAVSGTHCAATPLQARWNDAWPRRRWALICAGHAVTGSGLWLVGLKDLFPGLRGPLGLPLAGAGLATLGYGLSGVVTGCPPQMAATVEWRRLPHFEYAYAVMDSAQSLGFVAGPLLGALVVRAYSFEVLMLGFMGLMWAWVPVAAAVMQRVGGPGGGLAPAAAPGGGT